MIMSVCLLCIEPAYISAPAMGAASLTDRERLVGGGPVMFQCENQGIPAPMVTWYHNGETIQPDSGVGVNMVISEPQVSNSGVYQCVVSNTIDGVVREDRRQWVLEVREPSKYGEVRVNGGEAAKSQVLSKSGGGGGGGGGGSKSQCCNMSLKCTGPDISVTLFQDKFQHVNTPCHNYYTAL